jgi:alkaline phosphatase
MRIENGASNKTILDFLMNDLGYKQSYAYELLKDARKLIQEIWDKNAEAHLEEAKGQLEDMYQVAITKKEYKLALQIRQELNKLMGLYEAEKINLTIDFKAKFPGIKKDENPE